MTAVVIGIIVFLAGEGLLEITNVEILDVEIICLSHPIIKSTKLKEMRLINRIEKNLLFDDISYSYEYVNYCSLFKNNL